jgi:hypothetical protein
VIKNPLSLLYIRLGALYLHSDLKKHLLSSPFKAALLLVFLLSAWLGKATHVFFGHGHHHHEEKLVCAHETSDSAAHIHDERYATGDCELCAFVLNGPDQLPFLEWPSLKLPVHFLALALPAWETPVCAAVFSAAQPARAP